MPMKKYKIAVLDDYQNAAIESTDWSALGQGRAVSGIRRLKQDLPVAGELLFRP
jgi:hypothetical protein